MVFGLVVARKGTMKLRYMQFGTERGYEKLQLIYEMLLSQKA